MYSHLHRVSGGVVNWDPQKKSPGKDTLISVLQIDSHETLITPHHQCNTSPASACSITFITSHHIISVTPHQLVPAASHSSHHTTPHHQCNTSPASACSITFITHHTTHDPAQGNHKYLLEQVIALFTSSEAGDSPGDLLETVQVTCWRQSR